MRRWSSRCPSFSATISNGSDALQRLTTHEVGHVVGLHHPNIRLASTPILIPSTGCRSTRSIPLPNLIFQFNYDPAAVMAASPCGGGAGLSAPNLFVKDLRPDDIGGGWMPSYPVVVACGDELDDDGDGLTDYPDDPGCARVTGRHRDGSQSSCWDDEDGADGDGRIDFDPVGRIELRESRRPPPAGSGNPGCIAPSWGTESPQCQDGIDNDGRRKGRLRRRSCGSRVHSGSAGSLLRRKAMGNHRSFSSLRDRRRVGAAPSAADVALATAAGVEASLPSAARTLRAANPSWLQPSPGQTLGTSCHCLAPPIAGRMGRRGTPGPLLSHGSLDGRFLPNTDPGVRSGPTASSSQRTPPWRASPRIRPHPGSPELARI